MSRNDIPLISVVVPVYNVEKHLRKCVDSILKQSYKNLEIILVDDGSTDSSGKICDEYVKNYKNIRVIHQKNSGLSGARNSGIRLSKGEYISVIDSDDYIEPFMLESLCSCCKKFDAEIGCTNTIREMPSGRKFTEIASAQEKVVDRKEALSIMMEKHAHSAWGKIYKRELFDTIEYPVGKLYEDIITTPRLVFAAKKVCFDGRFGYHYLQNDEGIVHSSFSKKKLDYIKNTKWLLDFIKKNEKDLTEIAEAFHILSITTLLGYAYNARKDFSKDYKYVLGELKKEKKVYLKNTYIPFFKKIMIWMELHGMICFAESVKKIYNRLKYK